MSLSEQFYKETGFYSQEYDSINECYYFIPKYIDWLENKINKANEKIEVLYNYALNSLETDSYDYNELIKIKNDEQ